MFDKHNRRSERVLVVDDDPQVASVVEEILSLGGYAVTKASGGQAGVRAALAEPPDLILLDVLMPEMDGYLAAERFRDHAELREIPVIFLTACSPIFEGITAPTLGRPLAIRKPFSVVELLGAVNSVFAEPGRVIAAVK